MTEIQIENGKVELETGLKEVEHQVQMAYSDVGPQRNTDEYDDRCLGFLTDCWVNSKNAQKLIEYIPSYNNWDAERVNELLGELVEDGVAFRVAIGREGSPVLYFESNDTDAIEAKFERYADECWTIDAESVGTARKWADDHNLGQHTTCRHDEGVVEVDEFAPVEAEQEYIRAWWD